MNVKSNFTENYFGILTHDGCVKVAKTETTGQILNIEKRSVLVKSRKNSYVCEIHKDLYPLMRYVNVGDLAFVKFRKGKSWMVGYQKKTADKTAGKPTGDKPVSENMDWSDFMRRIDAE